MKNTIPITRPVNGADLDQLRERLGLSASDACWLYGLSMAKWSEIVKQKSNEPLKNATLALMARALSERNDLYPIPKPPGVEQAFGLVLQHRNHLDRKRFAIMFGCEASTGYHWMTLKTKVGTIQNRLFLLFQTLIQQAEVISWEAAGEIITEWEKMVEEEARSRGIERIFETGCWRGFTESKDYPPIRGENIEEVRERLGLSTMDARWLFGMSMFKWAEVVKKGGCVPLKSPSLSLLVRILKNHPEVCPINPSIDPGKIFEKISINQPEINKKRMAIMFGCEGSSGHRWLTRKKNMGPSLHRILKVFMGWYEPNLNEARESSTEGILAISKWDRMVELEAYTRGVNNVYSLGRWEAGS